MRRLVAPLALIVILTGVALPAHALTPAHLWSKGIGGTSTDAVNAIAMDASGNLYIAGSFSTTVDFGGGGLVSQGGTDIFFAKYNSAGVHQWSKRAGAAGADVALALAIDPAGNVVLTGYFTGQVDFGGGSLIAAGGREIFLAKYTTAAGAYVSAQRFGSTGTDEGHAVAVDASGNVFLSGFFNLTVNFGGVGLVSAGATDMFIAKYNSAGVHQWSKSFGGTFNDEGDGLAVDASGNVLFTGLFLGTVNFGGGNLISVGSDVFLVKYNSAGTHQWSKSFGSASEEAGQAVATDASSNVFITGYIGAATDFGGGSLAVAGTTDLFVAKFNSAGVHQWSKNAGATLNGWGRAISVDVGGNVLLTGTSEGTANFGGGNLVGLGNNDIFIAKYTNAGVPVWSNLFTTTSSEEGRGVVADANKDVYLAMNSFLPLNFGGSLLPNQGLLDLYLAKFDAEPQQPVIRTISDIGNDQGRQVLINFTASGADQAASTTSILQYEAYRRVKAAPPSLTTGDMSQLSRGQLLAEGWTQVGAVTAHGETGYTMVAPTIGDSTIANGQYRSTFYLRATTSSPYVFFDSPADSGFSKDNLAPSVPQNFIYTAGQLSWNESTAQDFDYFTVYGSNTNSFGAATLVNYSVSPAMNVIASPYVYYFVTATDFSGNEGKPAQVNTLSGVGGTPASYVLSVSNYPNPFNPRTTVGYTVPSHGAVTVAIYDLHGARVATLFSGDRAAGAYSVDWDGRTENAAVAASGVYFARIEHSSGTRTKKMVLLK